MGSQGSCLGRENKGGTRFDVPPEFMPKPFTWRFSDRSDRTMRPDKHHNQRSDEIKPKYRDSSSDRVADENDPRRHAGLQ